MKKKELKLRVLLQDRNYEKSQYWLLKLFSGHNMKSFLRAGPCSKVLPLLLMEETGWCGGAVCEATNSSLNRPHPLFILWPPLFAWSPLISYQIGGSSGNTCRQWPSKYSSTVFFPRKRMASREDIEVAGKKETQWSVHCFLSLVKLESIRRKGAEVFVGNE